MDFAVPAEQREKLKEIKKGDLAWELKTLCNMKMTVILIVIGALDTVTKGLVQGLEDLEIRGRVETIQITVLLRSARILRDLKRFPVTQTPVEHHELTLLWKTLKWVK